MSIPELRKAIKAKRAWIAELELVLSGTPLSLLDIFTNLYPQVLAGQRLLDKGRELLNQEQNSLSRSPHGVQEALKVIRALEVRNQALHAELDERLAADNLTLDDFKTLDVTRQALKIAQEEVGILERCLQAEEADALKNYPRKIGNKLWLLTPEWRLDPPPSLAHRLTHRTYHPRTRSLIG